MKLSVIIPAHNEAACVTKTVAAIAEILEHEKIAYEIILVDDHSMDATSTIVHHLSANNKNILVFNNQYLPGFGYAVRFGIEKASGDCVAIMMADLSDSAKDLVTFYRTMLQGNYDCVFGSRFVKGGEAHDYPVVKLLINRMANFFIRTAFWIKYNDTTNAFKLYKRQTLEGLKPFLSNHFNLTIELPLKAIIRGYSYTIVPNTWQNRKEGISKLKIREMGSRYFFIVLYCLIEKYFSVNDYRKKQISL